MLVEKGEYCFKTFNGWSVKGYYVPPYFLVELPNGKFSKERIEHGALIEPMWKPQEPETFLIKEVTNEDIISAKKEMKVLLEVSAYDRMLIRNVINQVRVD